ncbi:MAG TPA: hypothetical protein VLV18_02370, partial [Terriglobales bacterium]|nr:hypothetical protein [Terriglobales bacterium]
ERFLFGFSSSSEEIVFDLIQGQLEPWAAVIADLARGAGSLDHRLLIDVDVQNVDRTRSNTSAAHHAMVRANYLVE